ncbi:MAG: putative porin [Bacteroidales bacterium]|nr:putative porin [Bacteroidales bacterium]
MKHSLLLILALLLLNVNALAQHSQSADSTLVTFYPTNLDSISLSRHHYLDTSTFHANTFDLLDNEQIIYSTLSNIGLAHKPMRLPHHTTVGFDMSVPALQNYIRTEQDLKTYMSLLPYSELRYVMTTGDKEQHLDFRFGRQVYQGLFLSFEFNTDLSPGIYTNNKSENNYFWINALYTTKDERYRAFAYWYRNKIDVQENGGITYDSIYSQQLESDNAAILTNLTTSSNYVKVSGAGFQHYFNLLPQHKKIATASNKANTPPTDSLTQAPIPLTDSIQHPAQPVEQPVAQPVERKFTLGRINHRFAYQRNQLFYNETSASLPFYTPYDTLLASKTTDSTMIYAIRNSFSWNSLGYQKYSDDVPFYLYAGIDYDFFKKKHYDYLENKTINDRSYSQLSLNGGIVINLFKMTTITGRARLITLGYQIGDFNLHGQWKQRFSKTERDFGKLIFDFDMKRQSPTWFETSYYSNHFRWDNDFHASTHLSFDLHYHYKSFQVGARQTSINDFIYFNQEARPAQNDGFISVSEIYGTYAYSMERFKVEGFVSMNMVSDEAVMRLPTFLGKLRFSYAQPIFKKAAILQPIISVQYFTKYYADAYMPALRTFYLQDDVLIGNFPFIDLALAINVKQADIYVQYSNIFLLTGNHDSFIAPHYPMRDSRIFIGINWRLFN